MVCVSNHDLVVVNKELAMEYFFNTLVSFRLDYAFPGFFGALLWHLCWTICIVVVPDNESAHFQIHLCICFQIQYPQILFWCHGLLTFFFLSCFFKSTTLFDLLCLISLWGIAWCSSYHVCSSIWMSNGISTCMSFMGSSLLLPDTISIVAYCTISKCLIWRHCLMWVSLKTQHSLIHPAKNMLLGTWFLNHNLVCCIYDIVWHRLESCF